MAVAEPRSSVGVGPGCSEGLSAKRSSEAQRAERAAHTRVQLIPNRTTVGLLLLRFRRVQSDTACCAVLCSLRCSFPAVQTPSDRSLLAQFLSAATTASPMSDWDQTQLRGGNTVVQAAPPRSPSSAGLHWSATLNMLATPGPHPLPEYLKQIGAHVSALAASEYSGAAGSSVNPRGVHSAHFITPLLASFVARALTLEAEEAAASRGEHSEYTIVSHVMGSGSAASGGGHVSQSINLTPEIQERLIQSTLHRLHQLDDPLLETLKMQVAFESLYAAEIQRKRQTNYNLDQANSTQLGRIMEIGTNISSNAQVASLYRAIFKLMLANGCVESPASAAGAASAASPPPPASDRNVDREIAAALESVFPQSGLNAFNTLSASDKKSQVLNLINIVLGIRLFNRDIKKGGAGLIDVPGLAQAEVEALYEDLEKESSIVGEICFTYADVLQLERHKPGTISASVLRLQAELINRRQYILLIHQLQHEVLESLDLISDSSRQFADACAELRTLVGLRTSVPKEQIYPKFQAIAMLWRLLIEEREMNTVRARIFQSVLLKYRQSFASNLLEEDIALLKKDKADPKAVAADAERQKREQAIDFDEFVETIVAPEATTEGTDATAATAAAAAASYRPVRLLKDHTPNFMSLPLEYQGYCPWSIVHMGGLLLPGNPGLGIIRVLGRHYTFSSVESLREFCEDPEKYIAGVLVAARRNPALIHLLCLQPYILHSDISELFAMDSLMDTNHSQASTQKSNAGCQTPSGVINTTIPDPNYHWNEWDLRRKAIQLADLTNKKTVSSQTNLSHFRRDNGTQYTLPEMAEDGSMEGKGTQTGVEKSSQVERVYRYHAGLRGKPDKPGDPGAKMRVVELRVPTHVEDATNGNLQLKPNESLKTYIVRDRQR